MPTPLKPLKETKSEESSSENRDEQVKLSLTTKQRLGDATNQWLARNRSMVLRQTPVWAQTLAFLMISLSTIAVIAGIFFRIDEVVTVQGQLKSIGGTVEVETPVGGQISGVFFTDGEKVIKGQLLVRFDTRQALERKTTLTKLIEIEQKELQNQLKTFESQLSSLQSREEVLEQRLVTKKLITSEMGELVEQGGFQRLQHLEQLDQVFEMQKQITELKEQKSRLQLQSDQTKLESIKSLDQMKNQLKEINLQLQYQNVHAPATGVVFDPAARSKGVLQSGERILSIVPQEGLYAEVFVPNQDIGFVRSGQQAKVRVDAFPFTRYGEISANVSQIGADVLPPDSAMTFYRFPVKLELNKFYLESRGIQIPLKSGMAITTNLKLREKRLISLLSDLLVDQTDSIRSIRQQ
ncbi:HlyD family secretion protein [Synechococcus sp. CC9616]|uniref:HlyD family secretion protein n=1 Tax=Synechococcus sp. CC9616 TaxID=110663 RepID=UPI0012EB0991|nr:HlyD family efflux transporter periplasmic adaptor subunit [Synechococcus sp. CC9616]